MLGLKNATFTYKTAMSEPRVKTIGSTKWSTYKERSFPSTYFSFLNFFQRTSYKKLIDVPTTRMSIFILLISTGLLFEGAFPRGIFKKIYFARIIACIQQLIQLIKL